MSLTKEQKTNLIDLRIKANLLKVKYDTAKAEKEKAYTIERETEQKALQSGNFGVNQSYLIKDEQEFNRYLKVLQKEYKKIGLIVPFNEVYSYEFNKAFIMAEREYLKLSIELLHIFNKTKEEKIFIDLLSQPYIEEKYKNKIIEILNNFLIKGEKNNA